MPLSNNGSKNLSRPYLTVGSFERNEANGNNIKTTIVNLQCFDTTVNSPEEALEKMREWAKQQYPLSEGWHHHPPEVRELSKEMLGDMLLDARPQEEIPEKYRFELVYEDNSR